MYYTNYTIYCIGGARGGASFLSTGQTLPTRRPHDRQIVHGVTRPTAGVLSRHVRQHRHPARRVSGDGGRGRASGADI